MDKVGKYQILGKLGQGGMGVVYRALDPLLERVVALKTISAHLDSQPDLRARFFREGRSAAHLSHRNIITIYDIGEDNGVAYLAMEYLEGEDLKAKIAKRANFPLQRKIGIMAEVCQGLAHAHSRHVIHRDIKPANIFMSNSGEIKILDFGLARMVAADITRTGAPLGTPNYMSPEQVRGERVDHRADIFSVGAVFYELLALRRAFDEDSVPATIMKILQSDPEPLEKIDPSIDPALASVVMKALAKEPDARFQSSQDLLTELRSFASSLPPAAEEEDTAFVSGTGRSWTGAALDLPTIETPVGALPAAGADSGGSPAHSILTAPTTPAPPLQSPTPLAATQPKRRRFLWGASAVLLVLVFSSLWWTLRTPGAASRGEDKTPAQTSPVPVGRGSSSGASNGGGPVRVPDPAVGTLPPPPFVPPSLPSKQLEVDHGSGRQEPLARADKGGSRVTEAPQNAPEVRPDPKAVQVHLDEAARKTADEALRQMSQARTRADSAGASQFAAKSYEAAHRSELEARVLYDGGRFQEASPRLYETSGLYASAALEAESEKETRARQAEQERHAALLRSQAELGRQAFELVHEAARTAGAPQREPGKFQEASKLAAQAQSAFAQQDYAGAQSQWAAAAVAMEQARAAAGELARAAVPTEPDRSPKVTPPVSAETERQLVGSVLEQYARALRARDLAALKAVWPGLGGKEEQAIRDEFRNARDIRVQLLDPEITVSGDTATATARRVYVLQMLDGSNPKASNPMTVTLRKSSGAWVIDRIRF